MPPTSRTEKEEEELKKKTARTRPSRTAASSTTLVKPPLREKGILSSKDRLELAQARAKNAGALPPSGIDAQGQFIQDPAQEKKIETALREAEAKKELGKRGLFEEAPPERTSLDIPSEPITGFLQEIPVIGSGITNIGNQVIDILDPKVIKFGKTEAESQALLLQDPATRKEA